MSTPTVRLVEASRPLGPGRPATYYVLRWKATNGSTQQESLGRTKKTGGTLTKAAADKIRRRKEQEIASGVIARDRPGPMRLGDFASYHEDAAAFGKRPATVTEWRTAGDHAARALGPDFLLERLTAAHAGPIRKHLP